MKPIENYKDVTINERKFRIKKFDAKTGSFMLIKIMGLLAPMFNILDQTKLKESKSVDEDILDGMDISSIMAQLGNISEKDFNYIQDKCLRVCSEGLPAGYTPVLNENGSFGVVGLEEDTITVLALTAHVLIFNVTGFFSGSPLGSLLGGLSITSRQN